MVYSAIHHPPATCFSRFISSHSLLCLLSFSNKALLMDLCEHQAARAKATRLHLSKDSLPVPAPLCPISSKQGPLSPLPGCTVPGLLLWGDHCPRSPSLGRGVLSQLSHSVLGGHCPLSSLPGVTVPRFPALGEGAVPGLLLVCVWGCPRSPTPVRGCTIPGHLLWGDHCLQVSPSGWGTVSQSPSLGKCAVPGHLLCGRSVSRSPLG